MQWDFVIYQPMIYVRNYWFQPLSNEAFNLRRMLASEDLGNAAASPPPRQSASVPKSASLPRPAMLSGQSRIFRVHMCLKAFSPFDSTYLVVSCVYLFLVEGASSSAHALPPRVSDESSGEKLEGDQASKGRGSRKDKGVMKKTSHHAVKEKDDDTTDHEHQPLGGKKKHDDDHGDDPSASDSGIPQDLKPKAGIKRPAAAKTSSRKKPASAKENKARGWLEHVSQIIGCNHHQIWVLWFRCHTSPSKYFWIMRNDNSITLSGGRELWWSLCPVPWS